MFSPRERIDSHLGLAGLVVLLGLSAVRGDDAAAEAARMEFFEKKIRPVLIAHCYECHSAEARTLQGGLSLDTREASRRGGDSGHAVVPGDVDASLIVAAIRYDAFEMPPTGKLPDPVIADFIKWIEMGAPDPRETPAGQVQARTPTAIDWEAARRHWAFRPPQRHAPPDVADPAWPRTGVDPFIAAALREAGLSPSEPAEPRTLLRRLSFDLIGLPPTPPEVEQFLTRYAADPDAAVEFEIARLLTSPHFGERWAALWLDVMRYAEDQAHIVGDNKELFFPNAYRYRDWVIAAFNNDLPYDEFLRRQLAADQLHPDDPESHVALGFLGLGPKYYRRGSPEVMAEEWENQVDTLAQGLLGLTVACARCHDHKFDPVPTEDYYALAGVFAGMEMFNRPLTPETKLGKNGHAEKPEEALHIVRDKEPVNLAVMIRGDVNNKGPEVPRGFLQVLSPGGRLSFPGGRADLAAAIASADNPLTARVFVNRVWGELFGRPLVATPSNFGRLGEAPTHPELLDDLAARFIEHGWSLKWLVEELAKSAAYRQSSRCETYPLSADPDNRLLWRMPRRRMSVEQWRDALLMTGGRLDPQVGGPSIRPSDPDALRRTVYAERSRLEVDALLKTFDFPDPNAHSARRALTTTPLQRLFALNSPFMVRQAEALVERVAREVGDDAAARIARLHQLLFTRDPAPEELRLAVDFLTAADSPQAWIDYAQVLLASNEMLFLD